MTPKEKAIELIAKCTFKCRECDYDETAKYCANVVVDEIMNETSLGLLLIEWWIEVKKEIEKL